MFSGIIETLGSVVSCRPAPRKSFFLEIRAPRIAKSLKIGASVAVNGACLTVVKKKGDLLFFNLLAETTKVTTLGGLKKDERVNLERALRNGARLEGHFVLGHVDGVGRVLDARAKGAEKSFQIGFPAAMKPYILRKGSIAVDGVSLTLGKITPKSFAVHCIPHTLKSTNLSGYVKGSRVNLEADVLMKAAARIFKGV